MTPTAITLPAAASVTLEVFDPSGRRVATLLANETRAAGRHALQLEAPGWRSGVYLYRLAVDGQVVGRRLVVVR